MFPQVKFEAAVMSIYDQLIIGEGDVGCATSYRVTLRVARVKKFKINVTSHLKIIIFIIKDIQISKCDIIFENGRFWAFKGVAYRGRGAHFVTPFKRYFVTLCR